MSAEQTPTLQAILLRAVERAQRGIRQALPARVEKYDAATRKASVQPLLLEGAPDAAGERQTQALPVITNVPVVFPGSGGARVRWPINKGDTVLLIFSSASLDRWLVRGGMLDPGDDRNHDLNDCFALPGVQSFNEAGDDGTMIEFTASGQIHAGGSAALATKADIDALALWCETHFHPATSGSTSASALPLPAIAGTLKLKGS